MVAAALAARVIEVITDLGAAAGSRYQYGSGCVVSGRTVLTAAHVVAGAVSATVRDPGKREYTATVDPHFVGDVDGPGPDLALLEIDDPAFRDGLPPIGLARVYRDSASGEPVERCHAVGYPWFAETRSRTEVRDTVDAIGVVPVLSKLAAGLLSVQVTVAPRALPPQEIALGKSEWSGMSGAPVVASGRLLGVVTEHAPREGPSAVTAVPLTALQADPAHEEWGPGVADPANWWSRLGVRGIDDLQPLPVPPPPRPKPVYWSTLREFGRALHQRMPQLVGRQRDLAKIAAFATGGEGYLWLIGDAFAGKSALLYEAVTVGLPDEVDVICYFLSRSAADATSDRFLAAVVPQLAYLCEVDPPSADRDQYHALWERAADRAVQRGRHLLLVVDGLDEDLLPPGWPSVSSLLPTLVGAHAHVLVTSRPGFKLPDGHPMKGTRATKLGPFEGALLSPVATDAGTPLVAERLELALADGGICSVRKTPGEAHAQVQLALPAEKLMEDYRSALETAAALAGPPDEVTTKRIRQLVLPLQQVLAKAVPEPARRRIATEGGGAPAKLAAIELTLTDSQLERYPWELIADPEGPLPITVWRSVFAPLDPPVRKRWTGNLLLTGTAAVPDELAVIKNELSDYSQIRVFDCPGIPPSFRPLLNEHPPAAFHLVVHGPTLDDLTINPESLATDLGQSGVWVAVVNCRDSATAHSGEHRPPAYEIARRSGAATIGMAGLTPPDMSGLFSAVFYRCLARGFSALQGYHAAVRSFRNHGIYSTMWSIFVMYARNPNVIPFPTDDRARVRIGLEQVRFHAAVLDRELEDLAGQDFRSAGEWAEHAETLIVRTDCISEYLHAATAPGAAAFPDELQDEINDARDELQSALSETADSLAQLSGTKAQERQNALSRLPLHQKRQQRILRKLDRLTGEAR